jgi:hypothetical protein
MKVSCRAQRRGCAGIERDSIYAGRGTLGYPDNWNGIGQRPVHQPQPQRGLTLSRRGYPERFSSRCGFAVGTRRIRTLMIKSDRPYHRGWPAAALDVFAVAVS